MREYGCVCVSEMRCGGDGVASNFIQNAAIVPKIVQCRAVALIF